jgi:hypothetical protein
VFRLLRGDTEINCNHRSITNLKADAGNRWVSWGSVSVLIIVFEFQRYITAQNGLRLKVQKIISAIGKKNLRKKQIQQAFAYNVGVAALVPQEPHFVFHELR